MDWMCSDNTHNKWTTRKDGAKFISNSVYKLYCTYQKIDPKYGGKLHRIHVARWVFQTNAIARLADIPFLFPVYDNDIIVNIRRKFETKKAAMECLKKVKAEYAKYFVEEYPPIEPQHLPYFMIDGKLPPPFRAKEETDTATLSWRDRNE